MSVCLNMIVKNEAAVIERCLRAALPLVDRWCIVDTGSTDATMDLIRATMASIPGTLHSRAWKNFGHNRTEALRLAEAQRCDYVLFIDADEEFSVPPDFAWPALAADAYELTCRYAGFEYARRALVSTQMNWRWEGMLHEFLESDTARTFAALAAPTILVSHDGARARDEQTYARDIQALEQALIEEPDNARYVFYLAQSYRDFARPSDARNTYERRVTMGGWEEEVWYSLFQIAVMSERLGDPPGAVSQAYLRAFAFRPSRAEALVELARFHRLQGAHALAFLYAKHASQMQRPDDRLFVDADCYAWRALDEVGISGFYVGTTAAAQVGHDATKRLLVEHRIPASERDRVANNEAWYQSASGEDDSHK